jgi:hypothetical protein
MKFTIPFKTMLLLLMLQHQVNAQFSIGQFVKSAERDVSVNSFNDQVDYLKGKPYRLSMLNKLELRSQTNELGNTNAQRYGIRLSPSNPWEIKNTNRYFKSYEASLTAEKEIILKEVLAIRYTLVIELLYYQQLIALKAKEQGLLEAQYSVLERQQNSSFFDATDFAELKFDQLSKAVEVEELRYEASNRIMKIDHLYDSGYTKTIDWSKEDVISVEGIEKVLDSLVYIPVQSSLLAYHESKINMARHEYALEKSNFNLGFVQSQYTMGRTEVNRNPWGLSFGINIPITNPNKGDMAKRQLEVIETQHEMTDDENDLKRDKALSNERLKNLIQNYKSTKARIKEFDLNAISGTLSAMKTDNPFITLKLRYELVKLEIVLAKVTQNIMLHYIDFLQVHDRLQQRPLVNYLSGQLVPTE